MSHICNGPAHRLVDWDWVMSVKLDTKTLGFIIQVSDSPHSLLIKCLCVDSVERVQAEETSFHLLEMMNDYDK